MQTDQVKLKLRSSLSSENTQFVLSGTLRTSFAVERMPQVMEVLSDLSSLPIVVVLPADAAQVDWFDAWVDVLDRLPYGDLQVQFELQS